MFITQTSLPSGEKWQGSRMPGPKTDTGMKWQPDSAWRPHFGDWYLQSLHFPMLDRSMSTPSTGVPGLSAIFCHRRCSSPWESIQSTFFPWLTPKEGTREHYTSQMKCFDLLADTYQPLRGPYWAESPSLAYFHLPCLVSSVRMTDSLCSRHYALLPR